jgi:acetyl esterase
MVKSLQQLSKIANLARKNFAATQQKASKEFVPVAKFSERRVSTVKGDTRILLYSSYTHSSLAPVFVNLHGGGFILGCAEDDDVWCRKIANAVDCLVVNIDYCLAPENKFPAALEECYAVIQWLCENAAELGIDPTRIAIGGQSAGGNLAAGLCLLTRARGTGSFVYQILNCPPLDMTIDPFTKSSQDTLLTARLQTLFNDCYFRTDSDALDPLLSPLLAENLRGLPAALLITAEYDPLRPEAERYAKRLDTAGVPALCKSFTGCMHAFTHFGPRQAAEEAERLVHSRLQMAFRR